MDELRKKIIQMTAHANLDLSNWDPRTKTGMEGLQRNAQAKLPELRLELGQKVLENSITAIVLDDLKFNAELAEAVLENQDSLAIVDFMRLEKELFKRLFPTGNPPFKVDSNTVFGINEILYNDITKMLDIIALPRINATVGMFLQTSDKEVVLKKLSEIMTSAFDSDLKNLYINHTVSVLVNERLDKNAVGLFIVNVPASEVQNMSVFTKDSTVLTTVKSKTKGVEVIKKDTTAKSVVDKILKALANK